MNNSQIYRRYELYIGAVIGFLLGNFIGAISAFLIVREYLLLKGLTPKKNKESEVFKLALLKLSSLLIKADGVVRQSEKEFVKNYFIKNFGKTNSDDLFRKLKEKELSSDITVLANMIKVSLDPSKYYSVIYYLYSIAAADGILDKREDEFIYKVAVILNLESRINYIRSQFIKSEKKEKKKTNSSNQSSSKIIEALKDLGLKEGATKDEIKTAYRKLAKEFHPDKLTGMGEGIINLAKEKFQKIQTSYEYLIKNYV